VQVREHCKLRIGIIGCGVVGAAIAYELSVRANGDSPLQITLIDRAEPASGSTGAALGVLMGAISHKTKGRAWRFRQASMERYETLIPELEELTEKQIPFNRHGILKPLLPEDNLEKWEKLIELRKSQGYGLEFWSLEKLQENCSYLDRDRFIGAIYSPDDRQVHPHLLTQALVEGARKNGVECKFDTEVENIISVADGDVRRCDRLITSEGEIEVDYLIISAGLGSTSLTTALTQTLEMRPVVGQALQIKLDKPSGDSLRKARMANLRRHAECRDSFASRNWQPVITCDDVHIVPLGDREYWIGATVEFPNEMGEVEAQESLLEKVRQAAISFCPSLSEANIMKTWSGKRPYPFGRPAPIIEPVAGYSNVILATGHYRNGVLLAPATAIEVKNLLVEKNI
jgi:glycine/D-amino acid oxidase-like deaminating enzyme